MMWCRHTNPGAGGMQCFRKIRRKNSAFCPMHDPIRALERAVESAERALVEYIMDEDFKVDTRMVAFRANVRIARQALAEAK